MGLMMPCERKSVEPMAALTAPARTAAQHQSLLHLVDQGCWSDEKVLAKVREMVLPRIKRHGAIEAWIVDDTGLSLSGMAGHASAIAHPKRFTELWRKSTPEPQKPILAQVTSFGGMAARMIGDGLTACDQVGYVWYLCDEFGAKVLLSHRTGSIKGYTA